MAKISIIVLLCEKHTFINLAFISLFSFELQTRSEKLLVKLKRDP